jgi:hypothetical protein|nr:MAG TPA: hypothetical protein [Caudoviricetes sp.]
MRDQKFKVVSFVYKKGQSPRYAVFQLVTDIKYYDNYIVIEYYNRPESTDTRIIMTDSVNKIDIADMRELDAKRAWVKMNNAICGHDFTKIAFWPFEGKKSEIDIYPLFDRNKTFLRYTKVLGIERKWNHDIRGNELWIRTREPDLNNGFSDIDRIEIIPEEDIKKFIIKRSDHEDLEIKVNGGTYRDE